MVGSKDSFWQLKMKSWSYEMHHEEMNGMREDILCRLECVTSLSGSVSVLQLYPSIRHLGRQTCVAISNNTSQTSGQTLPSHRCQGSNTTVLFSEGSSTTGRPSSSVVSTRFRIHGSRRSRRSPTQGNHSCCPNMSAQVYLRGTSYSRSPKNC